MFFSGIKSHNRFQKWGNFLLLSPSVIVLLLWMIVPLSMTIWFSLQRYNLINPFDRGFNGLENYIYLFGDPALFTATGNTLVLVGSVLFLSLFFGLLFSVMLDRAFPGRGIVRVMIIAPFFIMPTASALIWKNLIMHPVNGISAYLTSLMGLPPIDWFSDVPMLAVVIIIAWQWIPFATLILLTSLQSLDREQLDAASLDGARGFQRFVHIIIPHLQRPFAIIILIETIFLLTVFAEIFTTTTGGPGLATTNLAFLIYRYALFDFDVGIASAGGVLAIILANIVAFFLVRTISKSIQV